MHTDELAEALRREGAALAAAAAKNLDAPVPSCPEWDVRQLLNHVGRVHRWVTAMVRSRATERGAFPPRPEAVDVEWFQEGLTELVAALEECGPDEVVWNMAKGEPGPARFWHRRQAAETAVHRWDVELAVGTPTPIETELALTGIDELLDEFLPNRRATLGGTVHFHATDSGHGEWTVGTDSDGSLLVGHGHEKGDVALRATASDLLLWLWGRPLPESVLEVFGDEAILDQWRASLRMG